MQTKHKAALAATLAFVLLASTAAAVGSVAADSHVNTAVSFQDQVSDGDSVVVGESAHADDYVVVVHADDDGPGDVLGHTTASSGINDNVEVGLDETLDDGNHTLHAMLHETAEDSEYGSPLSVDDETMVDDAVVTVEAADGNETDDETDDNETEDGVVNGMDDNETDDETDGNITDTEDGNESEGGEGLPGFTSFATVLALLSVALLGRRS